MADRSPLSVDVTAQQTAAHPVKLVIKPPETGADQTESGVYVLA
jgi:hypothetical protein